MRAVRWYGRRQTLSSYCRKQNRGETGSFRGFLFFLRLIYFRETSVVIRKYLQFQVFMEIFFTKRAKYVILHIVPHKLHMVLGENK